MKSWVQLGQDFYTIVGASTGVIIKSGLNYETYEPPEIEGFSFPVYFWDAKYVGEELDSFFGDRRSGELMPGINEEDAQAIERILNEPKAISNPFFFEPPYGEGYPEPNPWFMVDRSRLEESYLTWVFVEWTYKGSPGGLAFFSEAPVSVILAIPSCKNLPYTGPALAST